MKKSAASNKNMRILDGIPMLIVAVVIVIALIALGFVGTNNLRRTLIRIFLYCAMASMWNLMSGYTGMTSLGQQTFIGVAGYTMAVFTAKLMLPFGVGLLAGGVIGGILALILSVILFRMRGMYFAIATWVIAEALKTFFKSWEFVNMGGGMTVKSSIRPNSTGIYLMALVLMVIAIILIYILLRSKLGLGLTAMRDDADAASSVGVNIFQSKLLCFVICGIFCALAGGIYYLNYVSIYPNSGFAIDWTVSLVFIVIIGGIGTMSGPIVGTIIYIILDELLKKLPTGWPNIVLGAIAIVVIVFLPDGIMGTLQKKLRFEILSQKRFSGE